MQCPCYGSYRGCDFRIGRTRLEARLKELPAESRKVRTFGKQMAETDGIGVKERDYPFQQQENCYRGD